MKKSKLIVSLEALNSLEMSRFGEFVRSPFFNKHQETVTFFEILNEHRGYWAFLTKEEIYAQIYTGKFKEFKVNNLMFSLMELLKQFLAQLEFSEGKAPVIFTLRASLKRRMIKLFESIMTKEKKMVESIPLKDKFYYEHLKELGLLEDFAIIAQGKKFSPTPFAQGEKAWETQFILEKLINSSDMLSRMLVYNFTYELGVLNQLLSYIRERWDYFGKIIAVNAYYKAVMVFLEPDNPKCFFELVDFLEENRSAFNKEDLKGLYHAAIVKGIELLNVDQGEYLRTVFNLHKRMVEDGLLVENNDIKHMDYKNVCVLACRLGEFEWAKEFMESHRKYLSISFRKNVYNFNLAYLYYHQKNYEEALRLLGKLNYDNSFYLINAKTIQIKIFYELKEYDVLLSFLESYRLVLLRNKKISPARIKSTQNFIQFTRKFTKVLNNQSILKKNEFKNSLLGLKTELVASEVQMINKNWLLENLEAVLVQKI